MDEIRYSSWLFERLSLGEVYRLRIGRSSIGRHQSSVIRILGSQYVSRHHAQIEVSEDDSLVKIEDLQSVNGIFVNDVHYLHKSVRLKPGDKIGIGVIVDEDVEGFDSRHAVFILKYSPLSAQNSCSKIKSCHQSTKEVSLSRSTLSNNPGYIGSNKQAIAYSTGSLTSTCNDCIIISDDDDENEKPIISVQRNNLNKSEEQFISAFQPSVLRTYCKKTNRENLTTQHAENIKVPRNNPPAKTLDKEKCSAKIPESQRSEEVEAVPENSTTLECNETLNKNASPIPLDEETSSVGTSVKIVTVERIKAKQKSFGAVEYTKTSNKSPSTISFHNEGFSTKSSKEIEINEQTEIKHENSSSVIYTEYLHKKPSTITSADEKSPVKTSSEILANEPMKLELQDLNASENTGISDKIPVVLLDQKMSSLNTSRKIETSNRIKEEIENVSSKVSASINPNSDTLNSECTKSKPNSIQEPNNFVSEKGTHNSMIHFPILSSVKQERVQTISADIQDIFGETDDVIMEKLKDINPYVYNKCNRTNSKTIHDHLVDGDCIDLLSDEECEHISQVVDPSRDVEKAMKNGESSTSELQNSQVPKDLQLVNLSPKVTESNLSSKLNDRNDTEGSRIRVPKDIKTHCKVSKDVDSRNEDDENIFSQIVVDDMKAELAYENIDDFVEDLEKIVDEIEFNNEVQQDSTAEKISQTLLKCEPNNLCWNISNANDDYDEELENKVHDWSTKLFSQTLTQSNMSQVYEIDDEFEEESKGSNYELNDSDEDQSDFNIDFYTRHDDEVMDELYISLKEKYSPANNETIESAASIDEHKAADEKPLDTPPNTQSKLSMDGGKADFSGEQYSSDNEEQEKDQKKDTNAQTALNEEEFGFSPIYRSKTMRKRMFDSSGDEYSSDNEVKSVQEAQHDDFLIINNTLSQEKQIQFNDDESSNSDLGKKSKHIDSFVGIPKNELIKSNKTVEINKIFDLDLNKNSTDKFLVQKVSKGSVARSPLIIIEPPKLPRHKGRLRGVSAAGHDSTQRKLNTIREKLRINELENDLKKKWQDPNWCSLKPDKEQTRNIKQARKERLKIIADRERKTLDTSRKRKFSNEHSRADFTKKPKVKLTQVNRGEFLTKALENSKIYKIPKICNNINTKNGEDSSNSATSKNYKSRSLFEETLNACDEFSVKKSKQEKPLSTTTQTTPSTIIISQSRTAARAVRTTNKITFASMQRNTFETHQNRKKLEFFSSNRSCLVTKTGIDYTIAKKKKKVHFNDCLIIHFIERLQGAKKVDRKDIMPQSTFNDRRRKIRETYPIVDCSKNLITEFLNWGNEWLEKLNLDKQIAIETILPVPNQFTSFENYKNIFFPLMKLEFLSIIERDYKEASIKPFKVALVYVTENEDRLLLITRYDNVKTRQNAPRCDLVILDFNDKRPGTFAYSSLSRRYDITVKPIIDNMRIEFGAFNAVFQLESTPLFHKILNPLELLKHKIPAKLNIRYKGFDRLNVKQLQVLLCTYSKMVDETTPNVTLIKGPPGTGKSRVISNLALQSLYGDEVRIMDKKILICAQSNVAVDIIAAKLYHVQQRMRKEIQFRIIRYGIPDRISPQIAPITLHFLVQRDQREKLAKQYNNVNIEDKENLKNQIHLLKLHIDDLQMRNVKGTFEEVELIEKKKQLALFQSILNQSIHPEDERSSYTWYLTNANIVCTTLSSCVKLSQYVDYFDICIVDEATQCTEPWTLLPLKFGIHSLVLVGDTQQLPATVISKKAMSLGFGSSMFTRMQQCLESVHNKSANSASGIIFGLQTQYRMHPEICKWPNLYFYKNELINAEITHSFRTPIAPFSIINLAYTQNEHCNYGRISNDLEAEFVAKLLKALDEYIPNKSNSYGVITPYAEQRKQLEASFRATGLNNIMVHTIDSYQGLEKDVIIISNARTQGVGFLSNCQRLNVALTRPKKCLILCGNFRNLEVVPTWRNLLNNARERNLYHEIASRNALDIHHNVIEKIKLKT